MSNYKNNKPKRIKGCCGMCACQDRDQGLRNKRLLTLQEKRQELCVDAEYEVEDYSVESGNE